MPRRCTGVPWGSHGDALGCHGEAMGLHLGCPWGCHGGALGTDSLWCHGDAMGAHWDVMGIPWGVLECYGMSCGCTGCCEDAMRGALGRLGNAMGTGTPRVPWGRIGMARVCWVLWRCHEGRTGVPWGCHGGASGRHGDALGCHGDAMGAHWGAMVMPWGCTGVA
jgi:hypothetical protein